MTATPTLKLHDVSKRVGVETFIHPTSLTLETGHFNVLLGATNAGKTTLIKLMAGLEQPTTGRLEMNGADVTGVSPQRRRISLVHQFFVNYPHMSVYENIASPLRVAGLSRADIDARVGEVADLLQLTPMLKRRPDELSGGQQQRTALARAIAKDSEVVFLDEPLANLDYKLREELRDQLPTLFAGRGAIVVYATSEPLEALQLGGRTACMHEGRVTQFDETASIYRNPADLTTAQVFSDPPINLAPVVKHGREIRMSDTITWETDLDLKDGPYTIGVRPHRVSPIAERGIPMTGRIEITELSGSESVAHFVLGDLSWVSLAPGVHAYRVGEDHTFFLDTAHCYYFAPDGQLVT